MQEGITAVIIGGGPGERLGAQAEYTPKALMPVAGRPLLEHQLDWLKRTGIDSAILCLDCAPELVRGRFGDGSDFGVRLRYSVAEAPRGTAGAVKALGPASLPDDVLVIPGDVFPDTDCGRMLRFHRGHQGLATLALHECRGRSAPCSESHGCTGEPVVLGPAQRIVDFPRYPPEGGRGLALSPLWILRRGIYHFIPDGPACDFVKEAFPAAVKAGEVLLGYHETGVLADLGSPERYDRFTRSLARKR